MSEVCSVALVVVLLHFATRATTNGSDLIRAQVNQAVIDTSRYDLGNKSQSGKTCVIEYPTVVKIAGRCRTVGGSIPACVADDQGYLEPMNAQCAGEMREK